MFQGEGGEEEGDEANQNANGNAGGGGGAAVKQESVQQVAAGGPSQYFR